MDVLADYREHAVLGRELTLAPGLDAVYRDAAARTWAQEAR
jgi:hypothetical protein